MTHLDLFSGIGGFALAAKAAGFETIGFCEKEPYAQQILKERFGAILADAAGKQDDGKRGDCECGRDTVGRHQKTAQRSNAKADNHCACRRNPILHPDIFTLNGSDYAGVTLLTGGFPCQPFSLAGKQRGAADDRHLWPEMCRVIAEARPTWVLGENVPGIIGMELDNCLSDLEALGYAAWPLVIPACAVDARHRRDRVWIVAYAARKLQHGRWKPRDGRGQPANASADVADADGAGQRQSDEENARRASKQPDGSGVQQSDVSDASSAGLQRQLHAGSDDPEGRQEPNGRASAGSGIPCGWKPESQWLAESGMGRVANGISNRAHRLRGLGNAIVPQVAEQILKMIRACTP